MMFLLLVTVCQGLCTGVLWHSTIPGYLFEADLAPQAAEEKYNKSKMVHSIMRHVAETTGQDLEQLYGQIGWPLYKLYGHAFEAFKQMVQDPEPIFARLQVLSSLFSSIAPRTQPFGKIPCDLWFVYSWTGRR